MKLIDISHVLNAETPIFPGDYPTTVSHHKTMEQNRHNAYLLQSCLHTSTHVDVPMHLIHDDRMVKEFPVDCFMGRGVLLDVRGEASIAMKASYRELIQTGDIVLLFTGFDQHYFEEQYFTQHPAVSHALGEFLLSRKIKMLGMDMPSPDHVPFAFHKALLRADIFVLENLTNLVSLLGIPAFEVMAFPLKIAAEASFVRAVCRVDAPGPQK